MSVRSAARPTSAAQSTSRTKTPASSQAGACGFDTTLSMGIIAMKNHQRNLLAAGIATGVLAIGIGGFVWRTEARSVGKERVRQGRYRWWPYKQKKTIKTRTNT